MLFTVVVDPFCSWLSINVTVLGAVVSLRAISPFAWTLNAATACHLLESILYSVTRRYRSPEPRPKPHLTTPQIIRPPPYAVGILLLQNRSRLYRTFARGPLQSKVRPAWHAAAACFLAANDISHRLLFRGDRGADSPNRLNQLVPLSESTR